MNSACFVSRNPAVEVLEEVYICLKVLANRCGRDGLLVLKVVEMVPELDGEVFEHCAHSELSLAEGKGQNYHFFLQLIECRTYLRCQRTVLIVDRNRIRKGVEDEDLFQVKAKLTSTDIYSFT